MGYPLLLRFRKDYNNFWDAVDEASDLPWSDRAALCYFATRILDDWFRVPLARRALTIRMNGADGADDIIEFARRSPFVCCYRGDDGKEYAAIPSLELLATPSQRAQRNNSACPPPPADYDDPAVRKAKATMRRVSVDERGRLQDEDHSKDGAPIPEMEPPSGEMEPGHPRAAVTSAGHPENGASILEMEGRKRGRPKSGAAVSGMAPQNRGAPKNGTAVPEMEAPRARVDPDLLDPEADPEAQQPARAPTPARVQGPPPVLLPPAPPPPPVDPGVRRAIARWHSKLRELEPTRMVDDGTLLEVAQDFHPRVFIQGVERHVADDPQWWRTKNPVGALRKRCEWARDGDASATTSTTSVQTPPRPFRPEVNHFPPEPIEPFEFCQLREHEDLLPDQVLPLVLVHRVDGKDVKPHFRAIDNPEALAYAQRPGGHLEELEADRQRRAAAMAKMREMQAAQKAAKSGARL